MRRVICLFALVILGLFPLIAHAQAIPLIVDPPSLTLTGALGNGSMATSLRLTAKANLSGVHLFASDLLDATGDGRVRDSLPSSVITLLPADKFDTLASDSLTQIVVQVAPPVAAGTYTGNLTIRWEKPEPGQFIIPLTIVARTRPTLALQNPAQLTINGVQGERIARQVTLKETIGGSPVTGLQSLPQDLTTSDSNSVIPATKITVDLPADQIAGGEMLTAQLTINLNEVPAGAYSGQVLWVTGLGDVVSLPVMVNVRHGPGASIAILTIGVLLGLGLSAYMVQGKPRDEFIVRVAAVRQAIKDDTALEESFGPRLSSILDEAESSIRTAQWEETRAALAHAEKIVRRWRDARPQWIAQLAYLSSELLPRLPEVNNKEAALTLRKLRHQVEEIQGEAADFETPAKLRNRLFEVEETLARFRAVEQRLTEIGNIRVEAKVPSEVSERWGQQEGELQRRLYALIPEDEQDWKQLEADVLALAKQVTQDIQEHKDVTSVLVARGRLTDALRPILPPGLYLPEGESISPEAGQIAHQRLLNAWLITYILGGMLLVGVGYSTLYALQPTFGAHWMADYLALLTWGLGAQTTLGSVVNLLKGWDVPFVGKSDT